MKNSDLKNVLISAIETADGRLLSMLYAVTKTYQITETKPSEPIQKVVATPAPIAQPVAATTREYVKDDRPRKVIRVYRKPREQEVPTATQAVESTPQAEQRIIRIASSSSNTTPSPSITKTIVSRPTKTEEGDAAVSGISNNGGFITDLITKTV